MNKPAEAIRKLNQRITARQKTAFCSCVLTGLLVHLPVMLSDIPNHDGLASMYFDQNMITSGRWFLTVACGFSSYFTVPWVIGLIGLLFLGLTALCLTELLEIRDLLTVCLVSGLLAAFPALASTFAYVFTLDGYMMAMLLAVTAVLLTKKYRLGFLPGALCLAFSMGIYQAYLPFAVLLCLYQLILLAVSGKSLRESLLPAGKYLAMGALGAVLYYLILKVLLLIQGKELASYQGINAVGSGGILTALKSVYRDFWAFTIGGQVLYQNLFSLIALLALLASTVFVTARLAAAGKWWKRIGFYAVLAALAVLLPPATSCILMVSPGLTYHLLMRYQWVLYLICAAAFADRYFSWKEENCGRADLLFQWITALSLAVLLFCYGLTDNIAYSNLEKRYEKTYAYCLRLLDRIEQTPGYYQGIPVAMIGVVGDDSFPGTDLTGRVTGNMIGLSGDSLLYTGDNYEAFFKYYLGATLNILDAKVMEEIYYSPEYEEMDSFPGANSVKVVNGILYIKTENKDRD